MMKMPVDISKAALRCETMSTKIKQLTPGKTVAGRWTIQKLLGKGSCGVVFQVVDSKRKGYCAAMKVEYLSPEYDPTLKLEVGVLKKLNGSRDVMKLIDFGKRSNYAYMVTTLFGMDLISLRTKIKRGFNDASVLRVAVFVLSAIKQLHEVGYVHRDIKPGNVMTAGATGRDSRTFCVIDFGMARAYVVESKGKRKLRPRRASILLRGTVRYCSLSVHARNEQSRADDLVAMMYMLVEITLGVPWRDAKDEQIVIKMKKETSIDELFADLPEELKTIYNYLQSLRYQDRPDYFKVYDLLMQAMKRLQINFLDPYEWEDAEMERDSNESGNPEEKNLPVETPLTSPVTISPLVTPSTPSAPSSAPKPAEIGPPVEEINTAVDYDPKELQTKKPLSREELQFLYFPELREKKFREVLLEI
ncbi:unnamed protein product [Caenorhabditis auriculariae]|uniref:non-specific serine/threonine protein kinase n=1 Tax=Caenorhabditis auriculariae TaxID=2777116 RepID=A0A8S1H8Z0_9PELO|nr:unnamed protein product [Caenorhabditis auriculariae]